MRRTADRERPARARAIAVPANSRRLVFLGAAAAILLALLAFTARVRAEEPRTLDEVEIEGEVRLPQVLFITSREADRPLDWLESWSAPTAADVASAAWAAPRVHLLSGAGDAGLDAETDATETDAIEPHSSASDVIESEVTPSATEEDLR